MEVCLVSSAVDQDSSPEYVDIEAIIFKECTN